MTKLLEKTLFENVTHSNEDFTKHYHDTYTVGVTYKGVIKAIIDSKTYESYEYSIRINNPGEIHAGISTHWSHANFYPSIELLSSLYEEIFHEKKIPIFENHIINDQELFFKIHAFFNAYFSKNDDLIVESKLIEALSSLIIKYTNCTKEYAHIFDNKRIVKNTLELIKDTIDTNFSLDELAKNSGLSKFHFLRVFKKELGITPHSFIINERLNRAQELIRNGTPISQASLMVGFNDQSHFTRNFKRFYGYTPSCLKRNSNIIL